MRGCRALHCFVIFVLAVAIGAGIFAGYSQPEFLGPYLLLLGELLAVVYVLRSVERRRRLGHLGVIAVAICGTFVVLVSVSVCSGGASAGDGSCTAIQYWHAFWNMLTIFLVSSVLVALAGAVFWVRVFLGSRDGSGGRGRV